MKNIGQWNIAELNDFRLLTTIGYLNRLALISGDDHPFIPLNAIRDMTEEQKASVLASHIVYHDDACYGENGIKIYPIISAIGGTSEDGKLEVIYADTMYGQTETYFRLVDDGDRIFVAVSCKGADKTIVVTDGKWYAA